MNRQSTEVHYESSMMSQGKIHLKDPDEGFYHENAAFRYLLHRRSCKDPLFFAVTSLKVQIVCTLRGDKYGKKLWMVLKRNSSPKKVNMILIVKMKSYIPT